MPKTYCNLYKFMLTCPVSTGAINGCLRVPRRQFIACRRGAFPFMLICQQIELKPTAAQAAAFVQHSAAARIARDDAIALWREEGKRLPGFRYSIRELRPALNAVKFQAHPWFAEVSQNAVKGGYIDAQDAIARYYRKQARRPRFHGKSRRLAFRADNGVSTVKMDGKVLILPAKAGGRVKAKESLRWEGKPIQECRVWEKAGRWYASVRVKIDPAEYPQRCGEGVVGIDLGLKIFATIAWQDGRIEKIDAPEPFKRSRRALRRAQRKVSRRRKGSANRRKAVKDLARRHSRMARIRKDFLHQLSHRVTAEAETVVVESLAIKGWQRLWGRKTSDLAPAELLRQLEYKADWRGGRLVKADWHFPSSKLCHGCGYKFALLDLSIREWCCPDCGRINDRDGNAALNLRDWPGAPRSLPAEAV